MTGPEALWRIEVTVPGRAVAPVEDVLGGECMAVSSFLREPRGGPPGPGDAAGETWRVEGFAGRAPDRGALRRRLARAVGALGLDAPGVRVERLAPRDWLASNRADFPPRRVGRYLVHGSHAPSPLAAAVRIEIDAGPAFGTGEHPSTAGCLLALGELAKARRVRRPLDMGCGSGILAIAMAKTWRRPVVACDVDPDAVRTARRNARANGVGRLVGVVAGGGYGAPAVARRGPYDLVSANLYAGPLRRMAGGLARALAPGGVAVLSGLLPGDGPGVVGRHRHWGLRLVRARALDGWLTLVMARPAAKG